MNELDELRAEMVILKEQLRIAKIKPLNLAQANTNKLRAFNNNERFYMGKQCKYGHSGERYERGGHCAECRRIFRASRYKIPAPITSESLLTNAW